MIVQSFPSKKAAAPPVASKVFPPRTSQQQRDTVLSLPTSFKKVEQATTFGLMPKDVVEATKRNISLELYQERDREVRDNFTNCPFGAGDLVEPRLEGDMAAYGKCRILHIVDNYFNYGDGPYVKGSPKIITFECEEPSDKMKNKQFHATINFFATSQQGNECT